MAAAALITFSYSVDPAALMASSSILAPTKALIA
jgi:hypothetical protein